MSSDTNPHGKMGHNFGGDGEASVSGLVQSIRDFKSHAFVVVRGYHGELQLVFNKDNRSSLPALGAHISAKGKVVKNSKAPGGSEMVDPEVFRETVPPILPFLLDRPIEAAVDLQLDMRALSLRNRQIAAIFRCQSEIGDAFRTTCRKFGLIEIHTPKIVGGGTEGGAEVFQLNYFGQKASLAQSPQLYKQICCGAFMGVFEIGPVFRAENSHTSRHLTEFTGLDFETTLKYDQHEVMDIEEYFIREAIERLAALPHGLEVLKLRIEMPQKIPRITFDEATALVEKHGTISPERTFDYAVGVAVKKQFGSRFVFVTHYPSNEKPFYIQPAQEIDRTESFDFLIDGLEVSSGGERIHDPKLLRERMTLKGVTPEAYSGYIQAFEYGMPKHGGGGLGLERVTQCLLGLDNVREATLFVRDPRRIEP